MTRAEKSKPYCGNCEKCLTLCTIMCQRGREHAVIEVHTNKGNAHLYCASAYSALDGTRPVWQNMIVQE